MTEYILLLITIIIYGIFHPMESNRKNRKKIVFFSFALIFAIMSLRAYTVGRDLPGYRTAYLNSAFHDWGEYTYVYFEEGFIFFMKLCNEIGLSFQMYLALASALILIPIAIFIYRYSDDPLLSIILYICFAWFEFDLTGIRQALSMSICLIAMMIWLEGKPRTKIISILLVAIAFSIHRGAIVCVFIPFICRKTKPMKPQKVVFITVIVVLILSLFRTSFFIIIEEWFSRTSNFGINSSMYFGVYNLLSCILIIFFIIVQERQSRNELIGSMGTGYSEECELSIIKNRTFVCFLNMYIVSIGMSVFFGTNTTARSYMYYNLPILVIAPFYLNKAFTGQNRLLIKTMIAAFFIIYFLFNVYNNNNFDIYPYVFYWNL